MSELIHDYEVDLHWEENRAGKLTAPGISQSIIVATPPEFPGGMEGIMSPEHLFVASVSSCFMTTFLAISENSSFHFESLDVKALGSLVKDENGKYEITKITIKPKLIIRDEDKREKALRILEKSETVCIITRAIKSEIVLESEVEVKVSEVEKEHQ